MRRRTQLLLLNFLIIAILVCLIISPSVAQVQVGESSPFGAGPAQPYYEANNIGIKWVRGGVDIFWAFVDPNKTGDPTKFNWKTPYDYDSWLINELRAGLLMVHNIDVQPNAEYSYRKSGSWLPANENAYKAFVKETVKRYPYVRYWQVSNEPDFADKITDISSFADLQRITYGAIKDANPYAKVIIAGLSNRQGITSAMYTGKPYDKYYEKVLPKLQGKYVDIFDIHFYWGASQAGLVSPDAMTGIDYKEFKRVYNYYRTLLNQNGFTKVPIWITEAGSFSGTINVGNTAFTQTETRQAQELVKGYVYPLSLGVEKIFWACSVVEGFGAWDNDFFDHIGLMYGGQDGVHKYGEKKLAYYTYKLMTAKLEGSDWKNIKTLVSTNGIYLFKFYRAGKPVWVAWNDNASDRQVIVPGIAAAKIKVTEMVPKYNSGRDVPTTGEIFKVTNQAVKSGISAVSLKSNPVVIEESI